ncbi:MAG: UPF0182 family protein [Bryobacteraceae bacterium]|nr:UPF0182 family protein [Bryobacteraceae bacterium]
MPSGRRDRGRPGLILLVFVLLALVFGARSLAGLVIEYQWWKELGQLSTWQNMLLYSALPVALATLVTFVVLWIVHARGMRFGGRRQSDHPAYARGATVALLLLSWIIARSALDSWTIVRYYGSQRAGVAADAWRDPIFSQTLSFYLFELPFYQQMLGLLLAIGIVSVVLYYLTARIWQLVEQLPNLRRDGQGFALDLLLPGGFESATVRGLLAFVLTIMAVRAWLGRYEFLQSEHAFLVGVDYLDNFIGIPLQWVLVVALLAAAVFVVLGRFRLAVIPVALVVIRGFIPPIVSAVYVKPNEISLQKPYITHHIDATRSAYGLSSQVKEMPYAAKLEAPLDPENNRPLLDNVRLWDWRAFHDTVTQLQALRQYYVFQDTDVDRYMIDGKLRQVMLAPRELDIRQLPDARANWINGHFIYTHGYGLVMAEANQITPNGQPVFFIQDAPTRVESKSLQLTRPELYYGEITHEPVFVRTQQPEFNYPSGNGNVQTKYEGTGGIPITGFGMRLAAALAEGDTKVLLTGYLTSETRMMIRRNVRERVSALASFVSWDPDPYLVLTDAGRLVWALDGYTTSSDHPYSRRVDVSGIGRLNYIRNSVKATVDAYDGDVRMYVFDDKDPVLRVFRAMFPALFKDSAEMPADIRRHTRYPELMFRTQAEIYRTFHMSDPEAFYNREDLWDIAKNVYSQNNQSVGVEPTFVVATLPGEKEPEFLLIQPFTPRSKDNLIGLMVARSDGEHLGEIVVLQLSKQSLIYGPLQVEARIDSDANISKDLTLWNQQGSQVLRGQMLVLPVNETFLYVEPIYIQSAQAKMPQLKKVALAMGNTLVYRDTYQQALAELISLQSGSGGAAVPGAGTTPQDATMPAGTQPTPSAAGLTSGAPAISEIRDRLRKYRDLASQGKWAEAGRELEAVERLVGR